MMLAPSRSPYRFARPFGAAPLGLTVLGFGWLALAAGFAYLALATPLIELVAAGRLASGGDPLRLAAIVAVAAVPTGLGTAGAARLATALRLAARRRTTTVRQLAAELAPDTIVLGPLELDGTYLQDVAVGHHGVAVFRELPPDAPVRRHGDRWEVEVDGAWVPFEDPLGRTARDADRVRRFLEGQEFDFTIRVHAALVTSTGGLDRIPGCAVVRPEHVAAFLAALPSQRTLTADRLAAIVAKLSGL